MVPHLECLNQQTGVIPCTPFLFCDKEVSDENFSKFGVQALLQALKNSAWTSGYELAEVKAWCNKPVYPTKNSVPFKPSSSAQLTKNTSTLDDKKGEIGYISMYDNWLSY